MRSHIFISITTALLPLITLIPGINAQATCSATQKCPASAPCCSEYGYCGTGNYCHQGCEPLHSNKLTSCRPNPICESHTVTFPDNLDRLSMNATKYNGNATMYDWVLNTGQVVPMSDGLRLTLNQSNTGTKISSTRYVHYGKIDFVMRTSKWPGVVSAAIAMSDVKDEIDWEWTGKSLNDAQTNVWFLGVANYSASLGESIDMGVDTSADFHKYTLDWQPDQLIWAIDDRIVRTLLRSDTYSPSSGQYKYPTTPSRVQVSIWPGGIPAAAEGTVEWAGGMIQWNEPEYVENGYYWNTLKSVSVQCWAEQNQTVGTTGWVYAGNNSENVPTVLITNASTLLNAGQRAVGVIVGREWLAAAGFIGGALLAGLSVL